MGAKILLPVVLLLSSCTDNPDTEGRKMTADECGALLNLKRAIIREMCAPWDAVRPTALANLAIEIREYPHHYAKDDAAYNSEIGDIVGDISRDVGAEDCVKAGYPDPGNLNFDPVYLDNHPRNDLDRKLNDMINRIFADQIKKKSMLAP